MLMYVSIDSSTKNKHMKDVNDYGEMQLIINL